MEMGVLREWTIFTLHIDHTIVEWVQDNTHSKSKICLEPTGIFISQSVEFQTPDI